MTHIVTFEDVVKASARIAPYVHRTPIFTSDYLNAVTTANVYLKAENLQKVGAFKARGAVNAVLSLSDTDALRGVATHSSGNHGQAVAYACGIRGIAATVIMPDHAPPVKVAAVEGYGAHIIFCPQSQRAQVLEDFVASSHATVVHPFDDPAVIAGQGTASLEFVEQVENLDIIIAPIGGGGLLSGASIVAERRGISVLGAEPEIVDDAFRSLRDGIRYPATGAISIGDGLLTGIGEIPFAILAGEAVEILTVSEDEIVKAMRMLAIRTKLLVEPSGSVGVAALMRHAERFAGRNVGIILSGGNVDLSLFTTAT